MRRAISSVTEPVPGPTSRIRQAGRGPCKGRTRARAKKRLLGKIAPVVWKCCRHSRKNFPHSTQMYTVDASRSCSPTVCCFHAWCEAMFRRGHYVLQRGDSIRRRCQHTLFQPRSNGKLRHDRRKCCPLPPSHHRRRLLFWRKLPSATTSSCKISAAMILFYADEVDTLGVCTNRRP